MLLLGDLDSLIQAVTLGGAATGLELDLLRGALARLVTEQPYLHLVPPLPRLLHLAATAADGSSDMTEPPTK